MIVRFDSVPAATRRRVAHAAVAAAFLALSGVASAQGGTAAAAASSASAPSAASAAAAPQPAAPQPAAPIVGQYSVHPGQSLHDIAVDLTQSHDKSVLANVSQALFDANPNAFSKHDPSRLKIGAVLNVPGVPGVVAGASGVTAASAPAEEASAPATGAVASAPAQAAAPGASAVAAGGANVVAAAPASAASPASVPEAAASAAAAVSGASAAGATAEAPALAASGASAAAAASTASDTHVWSGAVVAAPAASAASAQGASSAGTVPLSSLQQLLALKNRVLMALQKHGIGKPVQPVGASGVVTASGAAAPGASYAATGAANPATSTAQPELSPVTVGIVAVIGAALLALILRLLIRKRKKPVVADAAPLDAPEAPVAHAAAEPPVQEAPLRETPAAPFEPPAPAATTAAAATLAEVAQHEETLDHATDAASHHAEADLGGEALAPAQHEAADELPEPGSHAAQHEQGAEQEPVTNDGVEPGEPETLADASEEASLAAASEPTEAALPPEGLAAGHAEGEAEEPALSEPEPEPHGHVVSEQDAAEPTEQEIPTLQDVVEPHAVPEPELSLPQPHEDTPFPEAAPFAEPVLPAVAAEDMNYPAVPPEFPQDAIHALGDLDMPLPPRIEAIPDPFATHAPLSTEPVNSPETTAAQAMPFPEPPAPPVGEAIEAGMAGPGSIAGLGAPRFGALTLDFDLNLPPDSAEALPVFTPEQLARIARNKLELAHEYIALGDLSGARSLINEVIESNDHATRADAQALLSTLAPLS
jgi:pilus assembly protein FimV